MSGLLNKKIRVLIVNDSEFQQKLVARILESDPEIEVAGYAGDGIEAIEKTLRLQPDVITMDIKMPVMNGLQATREIMEKCPTPILIMSVTIREEQKFTFTCLQLGALDFVSMSTEGGIMESELISKVKLCSRIKVVTHVGRRERLITESPQPKKAERYKVAGIAVSTGGPVALMEVLLHLPQDFSIPIVVVQHISDGFTAGLVVWLNSQCKIKVVEAQAGDELRPERVYLAPSGYHLTVDEDERVKLMDKDFPGNYHKPSADVMLNSLAKVYGPAAIGIIMTGMGKDGAAGIKAINKAGGFTIAQDEASSVIFGMNKTAIDEGSVKKVLSLQEIPGALIALTS